MASTYIAGPTVPPSNVKAFAVSSTAIMVQWDGLTPCTQVNGLIVSYRVQYRAAGLDSTEKTLEKDGGWNVTEAEISLTGLTPHTNYFIKVAAVNEHGDIGPYSDPVTVLTTLDSKFSATV